jgi:DNA-binding NtrC family response regulator
MAAKARVLLVDDEVVFLQSLARRLEIRNYEVGTATSGPAALEALRQRPFDVVVLDHHMPGMDGIETLAKLREFEPLLPVILLSGYALVSVAGEAMTRGAVDYLLKPTLLEKLIERIELALERKALEQALVVKPET